MSKKRQNKLEPEQGMETKISLKQLLRDGWRMELERMPVIHSYMTDSA